MKIRKTSGIGFSLDKVDGASVLMINLTKWGFIVTLGKTGFCASVLDRIFWRGTLEEGWFKFRHETGKIKNGNIRINIDWRFLVIQGAIEIERKPF